MNLEITLGLFRHLLTFAGAVLVTKGLASDSQIADLAGAVCTIIGVVWSIWHKYQSGKSSPTLPSILILILILIFLPLFLLGCVSATATRTSKDGSTQSIKVVGFLESVNGGTYTTTNTDGSSTTLAVQTATPDQQSIATLAGGVVELGKLLAVTNRSAAAAPIIITNVTTLITNSAPAQ